MRRASPVLVALTALAAGGCGGFRGTSGSSASDAGSQDEADAWTPIDAGAEDAGSGGTIDDAGHVDGGVAIDAGLSVVVDTLVADRSRLGARATGGYRPWRTGIGVQGDRVFWVENGAQPGLYSASATTPCSATSCVQQLRALTRATSFFPRANDVLVGDVNELWRVPFSGGGGEKVASGTDEIMNLASDGTTAFWTEGTDQSINATAGGTTSSLAYSNGAPVAMAFAGTSVWWVGVDISGQLGAMQMIGADGKNGREVGRFSNGFDTMRGHGAFLYYAKDSAPGTVHRLTVATGHDEIVANDAMDVADFAVDDTWAYWVEIGDAPDFANGRVRRVAHDSTTAQTLAVSVAHPVAIAVSGKTAFVAAAGTPASGYADGAILRLTTSN